MSLCSRAITLDDGLVCFGNSLNSLYLLNKQMKNGHVQDTCINVLVYGMINIYLKEEKYFGL